MAYLHVRCRQLAPNGVEAVYDNSLGVGQVKVAFAPRRVPSSASDAKPCARSSGCSEPCRCDWRRDYFETADHDASRFPRDT